MAFFSSPYSHMIVAIWSYYNSNYNQITAML
jgi:hypothetical protein